MTARSIRVAAFICAAVVLLGCTENGAGDPGSRVGTKGELPVPVYEVEIDGKPCLAVKSKVSGTHVDDSYIWSIDCDWSPR